MGFIIYSDRCAEGIIYPIKHNIRKKVVLGKNTLDVTITITPKLILFNDPARRSSGSIRDESGETLGTGHIDMTVARLVHPKFGSGFPEFQTDRISRLYGSI